MKVVKNLNNSGILKNLFLLAIVIILFSFVTELALRLVGYNEKLEFDVGAVGKVSDNHKLGMEHVPNSNTTIRGIFYKINSKGLRDYEYDYNKGDKIRVIVIGDSLTYGLGVKLEETFPKQLEKILGKGYEVINLGHSGYDAAEELELLKTKGLSYNPNIVIWAYALNDAAIHDEKITINKCRINLLKMPINCRVKKVLSSSKLLFVIRRGIQNMLNLGSEETFVHAIHNNPDNWKMVEGVFGEAEKIAGEKNIKVVLVVFPIFKDFDNYLWDDVHAKVVNAGKEHKFLTIDLYDYYKNYDSSILRLNEQDVWHPGPMGHELAAEAIYKGLLNNKIVELKTK